MIICSPGFNLPYLPKFRYMMIICSPGFPLEGRVKVEKDINHSNGAYAGAHPPGGSNAREGHGSKWNTNEWHTVVTRCFNINNNTGVRIQIIVDGRQLLQVDDKGDGQLSLI